MDSGHLHIGGRKWRDLKRPAGKMLIPGLVSDANDLVEHPEL
jgi:hypothetical protein